MTTPFLSDNPIVKGLEEQLQNCREKQFTGFLQVNGVAAQWHICFLLGHVVWVRSRIHTVRRWRRYLAIHSPVFFAQLNRLGAPPYQEWDYAAIARQVKLKQFRRDHFVKVAEKCIIEELFDIIYIGTNQHRALDQTLTYRLVSQEASTLPYIMIQQHGIWQEVLHAWSAWARFGLTKCSPDWAPLIVQSEKLKIQAPPKTFQILDRFINGDRTLRDLSLQLKQPMTTLTKALLPYISRKLIKFVEVPDILIEEIPVSDRALASGQSAQSPQNSFANRSARSVSGDLASTTMTRQVSAHVSEPGNSQSKNDQSGKYQSASTKLTSRIHRPTAASNRSITIIYIDDSPADSRLMSNILQSSGYRYINILDPLQALPMLIEVKPNLIFLDLVMPIANGYEVCAQIRRISALKDIPVVIVTNNDGIADRVRAKVVGASGFMGKPIQQDKVLKVVRKYLDVSQLPSVAVHN